MLPFHEELRKIRQEKGISLREIHEKTKIDISFLERMEEGDFSIVPKPFVRAFLREYAEVLELDPDRVMMRFDNKVDSILEQEISEPQPENIEAERTDSADEVKKDEPTVKEFGLEEPESPPEEPEEDVEKEEETLNAAESPQTESDDSQTSPFGQSAEREKKEPDNREEEPEKSAEESEEADQLTVTEDDPAPLSEEIASGKQAKPVERQRLKIEEPKETNTVFIAGFIIIIIIAAIIIIWINKGF